VPLSVFSEGHAAASARPAPASRARRHSVLRLEHRPSRRRIAPFSPLDVDVVSGAAGGPPGNRARYAEEFGSELAEIALAGGGRLRQLMYAAQVAARSPWLRTALTGPKRRGALL